MTTLILPSTRLAEALKFVIPAMMPAKELPGMDCIWIKPGLWQGWTRTWEPRWDLTQGITLVATDRYRLHVVGIECDAPQFNTVAMKGADVIAAFKAAPKSPKYPVAVDAAIAWDDEYSDAKLAWPLGATLPISLTGRQMPSIERLLDLTPVAKDRDATMGVTPKYLSEAIMAFHQVKGGLAVRIRHNGHKPIAVCSTNVEDSRSALVMPVRIPE